MKLRPLGFAAVVCAFVVAGCGGTVGSSAPGGASVAPAAAAAFFWIDTDLTSSQWKAATRLSAKFPGRAKLLAQLNKALAKQNLDFNRDVKPALGNELDLVLLDFANNGNDVVGLVKPRNRAKLQQLLSSDPTSHAVTTQVKGWTVIADTKALLDRFRSAANGSSLAGDGAFSSAFGKLDSNTIARAYVSGQALEQAYERGFKNQKQVHPQDFLTFGPIVASATAKSNGAAIDADAQLNVKLKPDPTPAPYTAQLPNELPAGALLYVSYAQLDKEVRATISELGQAIPGFAQKESQVESALGMSLQNDIYPLLSGEAALAVYPAQPVPRFEFVLALKDEAKTKQLVDRLNSLLSFSGGAAPKAVNVGGVPVNEFRVPGQAYTIDYAVFDHKLVLENGTAGIAALKAPGTTLANDPLYKAAVGGAGASSKSIGFVYVNLRDGLPVLFDYSSKSAGKVPADVRANTKPLQSAILTFTRDGDHFKGSGFVGVK